ncbi:hypothetical protein [Aquamicrobium sp. LC103]|nr:hypothetical protein [Aquamicrobium sp. LC103]
MLARRFTIVCLLTMIFGMVLATVVAQEGRTKRSADFDGSPFMQHRLN